MAMRLSLDYGLQWFVEEGVITAIALIGDQRMRRGKASLTFTGKRMVVEMPVEICAVRVCAAQDLSEDQIWCVGAPDLEALIDGLKWFTGSHVDGRTTITWVQFRRNEA